VKTLTLNLVTSHVNRPYSDLGPDGKPIEGRKVVSLIAAPGEEPQTTHIMTADEEFLKAAAVHGTPVTVTYTLGDPPKAPTAEVREEGAAE
jgi:hypothetical protein